MSDRWERSLAGILSVVEVSDDQITRQGFEEDGDWKSPVERWPEAEAFLATEGPSELATILTGMGYLPVALEE